jgi:hypothetical protein
MLTTALEEEKKLITTLAYTKEVPIANSPCVESWKPRQKSSFIKIMRQYNWLQAVPDLSDELLSRFLLGGLGPRDADRDDDDNDDDERDAGDTPGDDVDHQVVLEHLRKIHASM